MLSAGIYLLANKNKVSVFANSFIFSLKSPPAFIHLLKIATSSVVNCNLPSGGMCFLCVMSKWILSNIIASLSLSAVRIFPLLPPFWIFSGVFNNNSPFTLFAPWQLTHFCCKMGATALTYNVALESVTTFITCVFSEVPSFWGKLITLAPWVSCAPLCVKIMITNK